MFGFWCLDSGAHPCSKYPPIASPPTHPPSMHSLFKSQPLQPPTRDSRLAFRGSDFGLRNAGFGFRVSGFRFRVSGFRFRVVGFGTRISGFWFQVSGFGIRDSRPWLENPLTFPAGDARALNRAGRLAEHDSGLALGEQREFALFDRAPDECHLPRHERIQLT